VTKDVWARLGMSPTNKSTWTSERINMPSHFTFDCADFAPGVWAAICELSGGEDRVDPESRVWRDSLIINLGTPQNEGRDVPPQELSGWHVDGDFFVHYLDSPEQGLLVIPLFTDIVEGGGGTMICPKAIPKVARWLYDHPSGVSPRMVPRGEPDFAKERNLDWFNDLARNETDFVEVTGKVGDIFILHPLMLHSASSNPLRHVRIITNPPVSLKEPFCFDRDDGNYSIVERTTMRALGRDRLIGWKIAAPREGVVPARLRIQERMRVEEQKRMEELRQAQAGVV